MLQTTCAQASGIPQAVVPKRRTSHGMLCCAMCSLTLTPPPPLPKNSYKVHVWVDKARESVRIDFRGGIDKTYFIGVS